MGYVQAHTDLPIVADESVRPVRSGGIGRGRRAGHQPEADESGRAGAGVAMLRRAREIGLKVMLGCMIETSLGTTAWRTCPAWPIGSTWTRRCDRRRQFDGLTYGEAAQVHCRSGRDRGDVATRVRGCGSMGVGTENQRQHASRSTDHVARKLGGPMLLWQIFWLFTRVVLFRGAADRHPWRYAARIHRGRLGDPGSVRRRRRAGKYAAWPDCPPGCRHSSATRWPAFGADCCCRAPCCRPRS